MDKPIENYWKLRLADLKTALESNNFDVYLADDCQAACRTATASNQTQRRGRMRTGAECQPRIEHDIDRIRIACGVPARHDPQTARDL